MNFNTILGVATVFLVLMVWRQSLHNSRTIQQVETVMNSRLSQLIKLIKIAARAIGVEEGKKAEAERAAVDGPKTGPVDINRLRREIAALEAEFDESGAEKRGT